MAYSEHPQISVTAPCYNEAEVIELFYEELSSVMRGLGRSYEILFVNDGSTDGTYEVLTRIAADDPAVSIISFTRNFGHQAAITAALDHAKGDIVITLDSDLQHPPKLIPAMLQIYECGHDVVYAVRRSTADTGPIKRLTANSYYHIFNRLCGMEIKAGAADFRLMSRRSVEALLAMRECHRFIRGMVPWLGFPAAYVSYDAPPRRAGTTKYTMPRMLRLALWGIVSFSTVPLRMIAVIGITAAALGFVYFLYVLARWLISGDLVLGWGSLVSVVLLLGGVQLICMGVVAVYIGMIMDEAKGRPLYIVKDRINGQSGSLIWKDRVG